MIYHIASYPGLKESVATSQIFTVIIRTWKIHSKWEATKTNLLMLQWWKYLKNQERNWLKIKPKKKNNTTVFCTKYIKCLEKMKAILKKHWHIPQSDKKMAYLFKEPPLVVYNHGHNIGDRLVRSDLATQTLIHWHSATDPHYKWELQILLMYTVQ